VFQHITVLFSFVFAIALTHVLSCVSKLILARDQVRFSGLHALWMFNALVVLLINWISIWQLEAVKHWSVGEIMIQLGWAIPQYFTCSLISMPVGNEGVIDMDAFYERQRPVLFSAFALIMNLVSSPGGKEFWKERGYLFGEEFRRYVEDDLIEKNATPRRKADGRLQHRSARRIDVASSRC
jgi:hypothetical protein